MQSDDGTTSHLIRFVRIKSEKGSQWFAFVQSGLNLRINGHTFDHPKNIVVGPLPSFSILEYGDRAVFLYLNKDSVDYKPPNAYAQANGQFESTSNNDGDDNEDDEDEAGFDKTQPLSIPEIQPNDVESCKYLGWRLAEWKKLEGGYQPIDNPIPPPIFSGYGEWLEDIHIFRAIAAVTTAIELENGVQFAGFDHNMSQVAQHSHLEGDFALVGHQKDLFFPFNSDYKSGGRHWMLLHVRQTAKGPRIDYYDSSGGSGNREKFKTAVQNTLWYGGGIDEQPKLGVHSATSARQPSGWECGYFTILNAWCLALGMIPNPSYQGMSSHLGEIIDMFNLAIGGQIDSATIQAFMQCRGFASTLLNKVAHDRHFTRSIPFYSSNSLSLYLQMRRFIDNHPDTPTVRLDTAAIRYLLTYASFFTNEDVKSMETTEEVLNGFSQWLELSGRTPPEDQVGPPSPLSPVTPTTIQQALSQYAAENPYEVDTPKRLPQDWRLLRQCWNLYQSRLKRTGLLGRVRTEREKEKMLQKQQGHTLVQADETLNDPSYPYRSRLFNALDRCGLLPLEDVLNQEEIAEIRKPATHKIKLKLGKKAG